MILTRARRGLGLAGALATALLCGCADQQVEPSTSKPTPLSTEMAAPPVVQSAVVPHDESTPPSSAEIAQPSKPLPIPPKPLPSPPTTEPIVAIRIAELTATAPVVVDAAGGRLRVSSVDGSLSDAPWNAAAPIEIQVHDDGWRVRARGAPDRTIASGELVINTPSGTGDPLMWNKKSWPGALRLVRTRTGVDLVMDVPMESYLPGVIAKELYGSWNAETFRAQAIAARSYAVVEEARWQGRRHYDMVAGQQSQAWMGATENPKAVAAVRETRGQVLVHDGVVVAAYYSSACGGRPASALGVVTDNPFHDIAPLRAGDGSSRTSCCQSTSVASWKVTIPLATIQSRVQSWGRGTGRADLAAAQAPTAIEVAHKNAANRATQIRLRSRTGETLTIEAEDFRRAMNAAGDAKTSLKSSDFAVRISGKNAELTGRGFGHGVGLCQHGAQEMSRRGHSHQQILARYYPGSTVVKAWN